MKRGSTHRKYTAPPGEKSGTSCPLPPTPPKHKRRERCDRCHTREARGGQEEVQASAPWHKKWQAKKYTYAHRLPSAKGVDRGERVSTPLASQARGKQRASKGRSAHWHKEEGKEIFGRRQRDQSRPDKKEKRRLAEAYRSIHGRSPPPPFPPLPPVPSRNWTSK